MSKRSENSSLFQLTSSAADSRARISARPAPGLVLGGSGRAFGLISSASFASWCPDSSSWKTYQRCLFGGWETYSAGWPRAGTMQNGIASRLKPSAPLTGVTGSSWSRGEYPTPAATRYGTSQNEGKIPHNRPTAGTPSLYTWAAKWPTPTAGDCKRSGAAGYSTKSGRHEGTTLTDATCRTPGLRRPEICTHGGECRMRLNPRFVESLMGFPEGWTEID